MVCVTRSTDGARRRRRPSLARWAAFAFLIPMMVPGARQLRYDTEYPTIQYSTSVPTDPVARLQQKIDAGAVELSFDGERGYLASMLRELDVHVDSQTLVFSRTSFQKGLISPRTPRAIYFKDDVYVAWVQGGGALEISAVDPKLGAVFYTLEQKQSARPTLERQTFLCLRCHDSYSLTGGGVPRHIMGSGLPDRNGRPVYHEGWFITTDQSPIESRWGGWYVTGTHGNQVHMGNLTAQDGEDAAQLDLSAGANVTELGELIDTGPYLGKNSDIVALMVMEHQVHVQNVITRMNYDTRTALHNAEVNDAEPGRAAAAKEIEGLVEPLVRAMLLVGEAPLSGPIAGTTDFAAEFVRRGPSDGRGRSLRQLDLTRRLFRYPCSYLIYSRAFDALPEPARKHVYRRLREVLGGEDQSEDFAHLSGADRRAILEILDETKPDFAPSRK